MPDTNFTIITNREGGAARSANVAAKASLPCLRPAIYAMQPSNPAPPPITPDSVQNTDGLWELSSEASAAVPPQHQGLFMSRSRWPIRMPRRFRRRTAVEAFERYGSTRIFVRPFRVSSRSPRVAKIFLKKAVGRSRSRWRGGFPGEA